MKLNKIRKDAGVGFPTPDKYTREIQLTDQILAQVFCY